MDLMDYRRKIIANSPRLKSASGAVATFSDGADNLPLKSLVVNINPVQDLSNGDPSPENICPISGWDAVKVTRTGKNLCEPTEATYKNENGSWFNGADIASVKSALNSLPVGVYTISFKFSVLATVSGATSWGILIHNTVSGYFDGRQTAQHNSGETLAFAKTLTITESNQGKFDHVYMYSGGGNHADVYWYDFQLELGSTATPYEPYNGVFIQIGLNLLALPFVNYTNVSTDLTNYFFIKAGTYTFSFGTGTASSWRFIVRLKDLDGNEISDSQHNPSDTLAYRDTLNGYANGGNTTAKELVLNIAEDCYIRILHCMTASPQTDTFNDCKLEEGSTATEYQPYTGTMYGATINPLTGVMTVDRYWWELKAKISEWSKSTAYLGGFYTGGMNYVWNGNQIKPSTPFICSHTKTANTLSEYKKGTCFMDNSINIRIMPDNATLQDWVDYLTAQKNAGTPVQVCCYLKNPVTIQLTPQQIRSLYGNNTIFADTGNTSLEYWAHP